MKILVLNASPKGKNSTTVHTALYLQALHPEHEFTIVPVGQRIKSYEKDFAPLREELEKAELLLFCYPVYTFIAPYQLHRLIELIKADGIDLSGKFASQITTSKHFYDVTAHRYIEENCFDLGMKVVRGLSADMTVGHLPGAGFHCGRYHAFPGSASLAGRIHRTAFRHSGKQRRQPQTVAGCAAQS